MKPLVASQHSAKQTYQIQTHGAKATTQMPNIGCDLKPLTVPGHSAEQLIVCVFSLDDQGSPLLAKSSLTLVRCITLPCALHQTAKIV